MDLTLKLLLFFTSGFLLVQDVRSFVNGGICGRKFTDKTGSIEYPVVNKRNQYSTLPPKCSFLIAQPPNKTIILEIDYLVISDLTANCQNNRLEIRDGNTTNSTLLKKFCGSNTVRTLLPIVSKQNFLLIELITDGKLSNVGFRANYSTTDAECGVVERLSPGSIEIPGTSKDWVFDSNCIWVIRAPLGHAVELSWPVFNLEDPGNVDYCKNDYVEIYEGSRMSKTGFTGRYCFLFKPPRVQQSQGQDMTIHFRSSKFMSRQTFKATYNFVDVSKTCQGVYYANEGIITTPNHPMNYPDNASCLWILKAPLKHLISLSIPSFDVEYEPNCEKDYLEIRSGGNEDAPFLGRFCGNEAPDNITSYTNEMYIKFVSDSSSNYKGFSITWDSKVEGCGGVLQGPSGIIASPNYPEPYLPSVKQRTLFCSWFIHASAGSTIQFTFLDLDIEDTHDCEYDYVSISEIVGEHSVAPVRYCGKNTLPTVNTTANEARVSLHGFAQTKSRGFRLKYTTVCNKKINGFSGVIESPHFPDAYKNHVKCFWIIEVPPGNKIDLVFSYFDLEASSENRCDSDYLLIEEGVNDKPLTELAKLCGNKQRLLPLHISSSLQQVFLTFKTNKNNTFGGFRIDWRTNGCCRHFTQDAGNFILPSYHSSLQTQSFICEWLIEVDSRKRIEISFHQADALNRTFSPGGQLEIFNGKGSRNLRISQIHSSSSFVTFTSTSNVMYIRFMSDNFYIGHGFVANYKSIESACGGRFISDSGVIISTNYPKNYPDNEKCKWLLIVDENHVVDLNFTDLETEDTEPCTQDYIMIYDGDSTEDVVLGTHCGVVAKLPSYTSTGNRMLVVMTSDWGMSAKGFKAIYNKKCGGRTVVENKGFLQFMHSSQESVDLSCTWKLVAADPDYRVSLTFTFIDFLTLVNDCSRSAIEIYDGEGITGRLIAKWCKNEIPPTFTSDGNALTLRTVGNINGDRFDAIYSTSNTVCGASLHSESGTIVSPNFPYGYQSIAECVWVIKVTPGNAVSLNFTVFDLPFSSNCDTDYLEIRENDGMGKVLRTFCGNKADSVVSSRTLWLKLKRKDMSAVVKGFEASFRYLHENYITGNNGVIASPVYPMPYRHKNKFSWRIDVEKNKTIVIDIQNIHMNNLHHRNCTSTLIMYNGKKEESPILQQICGVSYFKKIQSYGSSVFIEMITTKDSIGHWFLLRWWTLHELVVPYIKGRLLEDCGGNMTGSTGIVEITKVPSSANLTNEGSYMCEWNLTVGKGKQIKSQVLEFDVNGDNEKSIDSFCKNNYLKIKDGQFGQSANENVHFCANQIPTILNSSGNELNVKLVTSQRIVRFKMIYEAIGSECGGHYALKFENEEKIITNPNFLNLPTSKTECVWVFLASTGQRLSASFQIFNFSSQNCSDEYFEIKDGSLESSKTLAKLCKIPPGPITSNGNSIYLRYVKNVSTKSKNKNIGHSGFKINVKIADICGGTLISTDGIIMSPYFPHSAIFKSYECVWTIIGLEKRGLVLAFDKIDLPSRINCKETDHISIEENGLTIATLCGNTDTLGELHILGHEAVVRFQTSSKPRFPYKGFRLKYSTRPEKCGGKLTGEFGELKSPGYPRTSIYKNCEWTIEVPDGYQARFFIDDLDIGSTGQISFYHDTAMKALIAQFTKSMIDHQLILSSSNIIFVHYSNSVLGHRGIKGHYESFEEAPCGGLLNDVKNVFSTPKDPFFLNSSFYCKWAVNPPEVFDKSMRKTGLSLIMWIFGFIFQNDVNMNCNSSHGFLKISDADHKVKMRTVCGNFLIKPLIVRSADPLLIIEAVKTNAGSMLDFNLDYRWYPCGGKLTGKSLIITSPSDLPYPVYCTWEFIKPQDEDAININFIRMNLGSCKKSYIIIKNGSAESVEIEQFCGQEVKNITVNSTNLWIEYYAIEAPSDFELSLEAINLTCGGIMRNDSIDIMSPGFPKAYPSNTECIWELIGPENHYIELLFIERLHIEMSENCKNDSIQIYEWQNDFEWVELETICGRSAPLNLIKSTMNRMKITFKSNEAVEGEGFRADWSTKY